MILFPACDTDELAICTSIEGEEFILDWESTVTETTIMELATSTLSGSWLSTTSAGESLLENVTDPFLLIVEEEEEKEEEFDTDRVSQLIFRYVAPVLIFVGVGGNMLSLAVLQSKYFRRAPSSFVLSILALVDSGVLLTGLFRHWIRGITSGRLDIRWINLFTCKTHYFFTYFTRQLSSWTLVLVTVERLMSVVIPLKARQILQPASHDGRLVCHLCLAVRAELPSVPDPQDLAGPRSGGEHDYHRQLLRLHGRGLAFCIRYLALDRPGSGLCCAGHRHLLLQYRYHPQGGQSSKESIGADERQGRRRHNPIPDSHAYCGKPGVPAHHHPGEHLLRGPRTVANRNPQRSTQQSNGLCCS